MSSSNRPPLVRTGQSPASQYAQRDVGEPSPTLNRNLSQSSGSSESSRVTALSSSRPPTAPYAPANNSAAQSTTSLASRPPRRVAYDLPLRAESPVVPSTEYHRHRAGQHSQGFFEPTLPTTTYSSSPSMSNLSASQIAAQAAMQVQGSQHARRRSQTVPDPIVVNQPTGMRKPSYPTITTASQSSSGGSRNSSQTRSNLQPSTITAASAASAAYPRSPIASPVPQQSEFVASPTNLEKEQKPSKEKSRMKIFSKPKNITVSGNKDQDKKALQSPKKPGIYHASTMPRAFNHSTTSLVDPPQSSASSLYSQPNTSSSTVVPTDKEKHRHHFLSRQKLKIKEANDHYNLPLSSAASNSRPTDPNTQPLYSFVPSSPAHSTTFNKSKTGLDLRHGGRALREKKREEKAAAGTFVTPLTNTVSTPNDMSSPFREQNAGGTPEWQGSVSVFGPSSTPSAPAENAMLQQSMGAFGLPGMTLDDAWPLLKARLLNIFEGEDIRTPIEDFNRLVTAHLQRCIQQRAPETILQDLRELVHTGFTSLEHTIRRVPDHRLVPHLVDMWSFVFGTILPFIEAVFHPLDLELKGRGSILGAKEAADFWNTSSMVTGVNRMSPSNATSELIDVRTLVLKTFRDVVILPRHDLLLSTFSRLSLENINVVPPDRFESPPPVRPGTAASTGSAGHVDLPTASFNSQGSTLLDSSNAGSLGARSRATSNTSAGSFHSMTSSRPHANSHGSNASHGRSPGQVHAQQQSMSPPQVLDSGQVTQTAARMLQCVSILAGLQLSTDGGVERLDGEALARRKMERLGKELKLNWLGRGRTGRNRRGFVGSRVRNPQVGVAA